MDTELLVDAHVHVASGDVTRFPRDPTGVGSDWWQQKCGVDELTVHLDAAGVDRAVVVQAVGAYGYDCRYAAHAAATSNGRLAFVGAVDMSSATLEADIAGLSDLAPVTGLRLFGVGASGAAWLTNGTGHRVWRLAAETRCVLVPTIFSEGLPALRPLMEAYPDVVVALDHCAFPYHAGADAMADLVGLADLPGLHLKVTSHNLDDGNDPSIFLEILVAAFGPARLCWGSDHPQHHSKTYPELLDLARHAVRHRPSHDRAAFLGGNALRLWW